jgi:rod shape-determining protein MreC
LRVRTRTWFSFVVALSVLFIIASRFAVFEPLEDVALAAASPIEQGLRDATSPFADLVNNLTDLGRLSDDNLALEREIERLEAEIARLREGEAELSELRTLLDVRGDREGESFLKANVFAREPGNARDLIAIDRGTNDGIAEGMVVLTAEGSLIGSIDSVTDRSAWVVLITDPASAVSAIVQESRTQGVVAGSVDGELVMEFVSETADVKEGDLVLTSGIGGRHPPGELIGQVIGVERTAQELFQSVSISPLADFTRLDAVLVLTTFHPVETP